MGSLLPLLALGFLLGMRHATDADHVVAVTTIVARERSVRSAAVLGSLWGVGHTATILLVGGAIVLLGIVIPPSLGLALELCVAVMLVTLGAFNVRRLVRRGAGRAGSDRGSASSTRPLAIGVVHGLAGSAAIALLVLATVKEAAWAVAYLLVFGVGTVAGMMLVTSALAFPLAWSVRRSERVHHAVGFVASAASVALGLFLVYEIGIVDGLFLGTPQWSPH